MTSIELLPLVPDAADRLERAVRRYEDGALTLRDVHKVAAEAYGTGSALVPLTMAMGSVTRWQPADADVPAAQARYDGPLLPGYDLALEQSLQVKLELTESGLAG